MTASVPAAAPLDHAKTTITICVPLRIYLSWSVVGGLDLSQRRKGQYRSSSQRKQGEREDREAKTSRVPLAVLSDTMRPIQFTAGLQQYRAPHKMQQYSSTVAGKISWKAVVRRVVCSCKHVLVAECVILCRHLHYILGRRPNILPFQVRPPTDLAGFDSAFPKTTPWNLG